jgi:glycosyltransferase involved in cell wall biosynthesis
LTNRSTISVALCTYNGQRFLTQQLASIAKQTRLPDELVVCDDGSNDQTVEMIRAFAASVTFPVKLVENRENLGSARNFEKAIELCSGNLIALSDQDDEWSSIRLERSENELLADSNAGLVFTDGEMIDDQSLPIGKRLWQAFDFTPARRRALIERNYDLLVKHRYVTGATVMFRAALRGRFLPFPSGWIHDEWIAAMVAVFSDLKPIDEPLISYRQHTSQQVGSPPETTPGSSGLLGTLVQGERNDLYWSELSRNIRFARTLCDTLSGMSLDQRGRSIFSSYQAWLRFAEFRAGLPQRRISRLFPVLRRHSWYAKHALGFRSALKDVVRAGHDPI